MKIALWLIVLAAMAMTLAALVQLFQREPPRSLDTDMEVSRESRPLTTGSGPVEVRFTPVERTNR